MSILDHPSAMIRAVRTRATEAILSHRVRARHPTMSCHHSVRWDYAYGELDAIRVGRNVSIGAFTEILVYRTSRHSNVAGGLILGDHAIISTGCNVRAAGGIISIGAHSGLGQNNVVVAANHALRPGELRLRIPWDETRCGVEIGSNVWVAANCVLLPGCRIGDNAVIAAGSVVRGEVPAGELWGGIPARRIRSIESPDENGR